MELHVKLIHIDIGLRAVIADNNGLYHENEMNCFEVKSNKNVITSRTLNYLPVVIGHW